MGKRLCVWWVFAFCGSVALGASMSVKDLADLKGLGFSENEIKAEVQRTKSQFILTAADEAALKTAGFSDDLLAFLRSTAPRKPMTNDDVVAMVRQRKSPEAVIEEIAKAARAFTLTPPVELQLKRQGVPHAVILAMRAKPLDAADLKALAVEKTSESVYARLAAFTGYAKVEVTPPMALDLARAGVPKAIIAQFRAGRGDGPGGLPELRQIGRWFTLRYPAGWSALRDIEDCEVRHAITPDAGVAHVKDIQRGITVGLMAADASSPVAAMDAVAALRHLLPIARAGEPDMIPEGDAQPAKLGKLDAARIRFNGRLKDKTGDFTGDLYLAREGRLICIVQAIAPKAEFAAMTPVFERILADSTFGPERPTQRGASVPAADIVSRYRESVIQVIAYDDGKDPVGTGSGVIISPDGYALTNAHVVMDLEDMRVHKRFEAAWDETLRRPRQPVLLVDKRFKPSRTSLGLHHGVDVALIKLPPGQYKPMPLTSLGDVVEGDAVVTLGFPVSSLFETLAVFITQGVVTRFNRDLAGRVESIYTDAKVTHGNSGGPCVSLVTGGVIGLNTFGQDIHLEKDNALAEHLNYLVGYYGVLPADVARDTFPLVVDLGLAHDAKLSFLDNFELARLFLAKGSVGAALDRAAKALEQQPGSADAGFLWALCRVGELDDAKQLAEARQTLEKALASDPKHEASLLLLTAIALGQNDTIRAIQYADRAVAAHPDSWQAYHERAAIYYRMKRYAEALADEAKAKASSRNVVPDPYLLAGQVLYDQGKLAEGREEFLQASRIHPKSLEARLGLARFYELEKNYESALLEYGRMEPDFPDNPYVMGRMASCYAKLRRNGDAVAGFEKAIDRFDRLGLLPTEDILIENGQILAEAMRRLDDAIVAYARYLKYYPDSDRAYDVHRKLASVMLDTDRRGMAHAHLLRARTLRPGETEVEAQLRQLNLPALSYADILRFIKMNYAADVVADLVRVTPLDFQLDVKNKDLLETVIKKHGVPISVVAAIIVSNRNLGVRKAAQDNEKEEGQQNKDDAQAAKDQPAAKAARVLNQHERALVGLWAGSMMAGPNVSMGQVRVEMRADGTYSSDMQFGAQRIEEIGRWNSDGKLLRYNSDTGTSASFLYKLVDANRFMLNMPGVGQVQMIRLQ